jgi:hypothetical protein
MPPGMQSKVIEKEEFTPYFEAARTTGKCPLVGWSVAQPDMGKRELRPLRWLAERVQREVDRVWRDVIMSACTHKNSGSS